MSWLGKLGRFLAGSTTGDKLLESSIAGIDKAFYTEEEKADRRAKAYDKWHELTFMLAEKDTHTGINRRKLADKIVDTILTTFLASVVLGMFDRVDEVNMIIQLVEKFWLGEAFVAVLAFYYGPHMLRRNSA